MTRLLQAILNWCRHCKGISFHLKHAALLQKVRAD
jgi:hypothetical protein